MCVCVCSYACIQEVHVQYLRMSLEAQLAYVTSITISYCSRQRCHSLHNPHQNSSINHTSHSSLSVLCVPAELSVISACLTVGSFCRCRSPEETQDVQRRGVAGDGLCIIQCSHHKQHNGQDHYASHLRCAKKK